MAFGSISIRMLQDVKEKEAKKKISLSTGAEPPVKDPIDITPPVQNEPVKEEKSYVEEINAGFTPNYVTDTLRIAIVAADTVQAKDFVCALYYSLSDFFSNTGITSFTRDHSTIKMVTGTKQYLERVIFNSPGHSVTCSSELAATDSYTFILGQAANQKLSLNLNFSCFSYANAETAKAADLVLILLNKSDRELTKETVAGLAGRFSARPVSWVITGFEREKIYYSSEINVPPSEALKSKLKEALDIPMKNSDQICYAQQYGALAVESHEGALPVYTVLSECREYTPTACSLSLVYSFLQYGKNCPNNGSVVSAIYGIIKSVVTSKQLNSSWHDEFTAAEGK